MHIRLGILFQISQQVLITHAKVVEIKKLYAYDINPSKIYEEIYF